MAPEKGDAAQRWMFICLILMCLTCESVIGVTLAREKLLEIRYSVTNVGYKPSFLQNLDISIPLDPTSSTFVPKRKKRGKRAGVLVRLRRRSNRPPLPAFMLSNVRSLANKIDEFSTLIKFNHNFKECSAFCFSETWLNPDIPDCAVVQPPGFSLFIADRDPELSHKSDVLLF